MLSEVRAPYHPANRTAVEVEDAIVAKRKDSMTADWTVAATSPSICVTCRGRRRSRRLADPAGPWPDRRRSLEGAPHAGRSTPRYGPTRAGRWTTGTGNSPTARREGPRRARRRQPYAVGCTAMLHCTGAAVSTPSPPPPCCSVWPARSWSENAKAFIATLAAAWRRSASPPATPAPTARRTTAWPNASTRPFRSGSPSSPAPPPSTSFRPSSTCSASSTHPTTPPPRQPTLPADVWIHAPQDRPQRPAPRQPPPSTTAPSTPASVTPGVRHQRRHRRDGQAPEP